MTLRITDLADPRWMRLFTGVRQSWFRLETLRRYDVDYEADEYAAFLRDGHLDHEPDDWQHLLARHTAAGRRLQRVHVIEEPLTDYLRYELAVYAVNERAGEDIRLIPVRRGVWPAGLPKDRDFWLFDDSDGWAMEYDADGRFIAAERTTAPTEIEQCRQWRDMALAGSIPLTAYTQSADSK